MVKLLNAFPEMPADVAYFLASLYVSRTAANEPVDDLDAFVIFRSWDPAEREDYEEAVRRGWIRPVPTVFNVNNEGQVVPVPEFVICTVSDRLIKKASLMVTRGRINQDVESTPTRAQSRSRWWSNNLLY
jgi:hypothetical protein